MLVSDMITDLTAALAQFPDAADWRVGIACYTDGPGSDINVMYVASHEADDAQDFTLVPEGMGAGFGLDETPLTAGELLAALGSNPAWASFAAYAAAEAVELPDGRRVSRNEPLWGTGVHEGARLVYFYYGDAEAAA